VFLKKGVDSSFLRLVACGANRVVLRYEFGLCNRGRGCGSSSAAAATARHEQTGKEKDGVGTAPEAVSL
jgi:hypothetical protein